MADYLRNPTLDWRASDGTVIKLDYVFCTKRFHVWVQPKGDTQAYWVGESKTPGGAEALIKGCLSTWTKVTEAQIRAGIGEITSQALAS